MYLRMLSINSAMMKHNQLLEQTYNLHNLRHLIISGLDDLKYLFSSSMVNSLSKLEYFEIQSCKLMEVVVVIEGNGQSAVKLPNLNELHLDGLPKLTRFSNFTGNSIDLSSVSKLWITNCPKMEMFISNSHCTNRPSRTEYSEVETGNIFQDTSQHFFDEKVIYSSFFSNSPSLCILIS